MAIDPEVLIDSLKNNIENIGNRKPGYKKELYVAVTQIIAKETDTKNTGSIVREPVKDIIKRLGGFLNDN
jgi:hypothetical protein